MGSANRDNGMNPRRKGKREEKKSEWYLQRTFPIGAFRAQYREDVDGAPSVGCRQDDLRIASNLPADLMPVLDYRVCGIDYGAIHVEKLREIFR